MIMLAAALALTTAVLTQADAVPADLAPPPRVSIVATCAAAPPAPGGVVAGPVLQVIDGRTLCVALGPTPDRWVRVRLADVLDPTARGALMAASFAKDAACSVERLDEQGMVGRCVVEGAPLARLVGGEGARIQAAAWR